MQKGYSKDTWMDPRVEIRESTTHGKGLFANSLISKGEAVMIWGGDIFSEKDVLSRKVREQSVVPIDEGIYLSDPKEAPQDPDEFLNHSCDSNLWMDDEVTLSARRDIQKGEELTLDYALFEGDPTWQMECKCGSQACRKRITGNDWRRGELRERYQGHFSPYLVRRMKK